MKSTLICPNPSQFKIKFLSSLFGLFILSLATLAAQETSVFIGATGGFNRSIFKHTDDLAKLYADRNAVTGVNAGVTAGIQIQKFTLTTGLTYMQTGGIYATENFRDREGTGYFSAKEKLHFLSVPLLLGYRQPLTEKVGLSLAMGPSFNFGVSGQLEETIEYFGSEDVKKDFHSVYFGTGVNEDYRKMQVGFQITPGMYVQLNDKSTITMNVNWDSGVSDVFNKRYKQANTFFDDNSGKQFARSTMITVGYEYRFSLEDKY